MNLRYPNITALSEKEQLVQIKSYLHQLVDQLNYGLPNASSGGSASTQTVNVQGGEVSYYDLRSMVIHELQQLEKKFDQLSEKVEADVDVAVENALEEAKASGEFDGPQGLPGDDYVLTEADEKEIAAQVSGMISFTLDEEGNLYYEVITDENTNNEVEE
jgi:hypothetical protein